MQTKLSLLVIVLAVLAIIFVAFVADRHRKGAFDDWPFLAGSYQGRPLYEASVP